METRQSNSKVATRRDLHVGVIEWRKAGATTEPTEQEIKRDKQEIGGIGQRWESQRDIESIDRLKKSLANETDWLVLLKGGESFHVG